MLYFSESRRHALDYESGNDLSALPFHLSHPCLIARRCEHPRARPLGRASLPRDRPLSIKTRASRHQRHRPHAIRHRRPRAPMPPGSASGRTVAPSHASICLPIRRSPWLARIGRLSHEPHVVKARENFANKSTQRGKGKECREGATKAERFASDFLRELLALPP